MLYLDNSATSFKKPLRVYASLMLNTVFNGANAGRGSGKLSMRALKPVIRAQETLAELFGIQCPQSIAFTYNATYAINMCILGAVGEAEHIIVTEADHNSVLRPAFRHGNVTVVPADKTGFVSPAAVEKAIRPNTRLIACTHASNVCGTLEPIYSIGKIAHDNGILLLIDAAQTAGCVPIDADGMNADFIAFSGHKGLMGSLGTGGLYVRDESTLRPVITGGTGSMSESPYQPSFMPDMLHAGTINSPGIAALGKAAEIVAKAEVKNIWTRERELANMFSSELKNMDGVTVYGRMHRTGTTAFNIDGLGSERTEELMGKNIAVRAGYHCAPLAHRALGTSETGAVRVSFGFFNRFADVRRAVDAVYRALKESRPERNAG